MLASWCAYKLLFLRLVSQELLPCPIEYAMKPAHRALSGSTFEVHTTAAELASIAHMPIMIGTDGNAELQSQQNIGPIDARWEGSVLQRLAARFMPGLHSGSRNPH